MKLKFDVTQPELLRRPRVARCLQVELDLRLAILLRGGLEVDHDDTAIRVADDRIDVAVERPFKHLASRGVHEHHKRAVVDLVKRLHHWGRIAIVPAKVMTSGRRWRELGPWRTGHNQNNRVAAIKANREAVFVHSHKYEERFVDDPNLWAQVLRAYPNVFRQEQLVFHQMLKDAQIQRQKELAIHEMFAP